MPKKTVPLKAKPLKKPRAKAAIGRPAQAKSKAPLKTAEKPKEKLADQSVTAEKIQATVLGVDGKKVGRVGLPAEVFGAKVNKQLLAQAVRVYLANQRAGTASTKTRGEVVGSTRKIYRQKGTGKARHGAIRAPIFVGGGIVFGPKPRDYSLKLPAKMKRKALCSALTVQYQDGHVIVVDGLERLEPKTKHMAKALTTVGAHGRTLFVIPKDAALMARAARNIADVDVLPAHCLNTYDVVTHATIVFTKDAAQTLSHISV